VIDLETTIFMDDEFSQINERALINLENGKDVWKGD